jgi:predicted unusual protein kinase regulating ubiquinone biosynthesis (AarF/ABC1/UbiB family)
MADKTTDDGISTGRIRRAAPVAGLAARTAGEAVLTSLRRHGQGPDADQYARRAERYVEVLGRSKGALMKAGQLLSFVPFSSAVPEANRALYQAAMSRLQADAPPMAPELAAEVIEAELGRAPREVFAEFSPLPLAAASIGQVHAARLHDGREVAVKVQYPGVAAAIDADLKNTELLAVFFQLMRSMVPGLTRMDPQVIAGEISSRIREELDYRIEASNQTLFADAYDGHPFIRVPHVVPELSTQRVLTQDLSHGMPWAEAITCAQPLKNQWGETINRFVFGSLRRLHAFNADPHPGNYLFHDDGSVTFLDFGCVKRFTYDQVQQMRRVVVAATRQDAVALRRSFVDAGIFDADKGPSAQEVLDWYSVPFEMLVAPQPFTMTPELVARVIEHEFSPTGPSSSVVRHLNSPGDYVFMTRIDMGLMSVLAELRATADWRAIQGELDFGDPPSSALGQADLDFWGAPLAAVST